jgi:hypothetical protein
MPRHPNKVNTVTLTISTTPGVRTYLDKLVSTGLFGKNHAEAAERLVARGIEALIREGTLKRRA